MFVEAGHGVTAFGAVPASGVIEKVLDGDVLKAGVVRGFFDFGGFDVGKQGKGGLTEIEFLFLDELHDGDGGDGFGDGGDAEE